VLLAGWEGQIPNQILLLLISQQCFPFAALFLREKDSTIR